MTIFDFFLSCVAYARFAAAPARPPTSSNLGRAAVSCCFSFPPSEVSRYSIRNWRGVTNGEQFRRRRHGARARNGEQLLCGGSMWGGKRLRHPSGAFCSNRHGKSVLRNGLFVARSFRFPKGLFSPFTYCEFASVLSVGRPEGFVYSVLAS